MPTKSAAPNTGGNKANGATRIAVVSGYKNGAMCPYALAATAAYGSCPASSARAPSQYQVKSSAS